MIKKSGYMTITQKITDMSDNELWYEKLRIK